METVATEPTNVIIFPLKNKNLAAISNASLEEMKEKVEQNKIEFVNFVCAEVIEELFFKLNLIGFNFDGEEYTKDGVLVIEALKSLLLKTMGLQHEMQLAAEKLIEIPPDDED